ncbi:hypothetical protein IFM89_018427 [Coptis chinensis]|uniref:Pentatricopeptide repeat-containing protein n=1 Tax=Coptis chinensis TaxID=261450 RepID=A0A835HU28_9MAGN|nr:hypothetical protein IFM89_018427 [Coptis chinensis]
MVYRGMSVHGLCVKWGFEKNLFVALALAFVYVTTGRIYEAKIVFDGMAERDTVLLAMFLWDILTCGAIAEFRSI